MAELQLQVCEFQLHIDLFIVFVFEVAQLNCQVVFDLPKCLEFTPPFVYVCVCAHTACVL